MCDCRVVAGCGCESIKDHIEYIVVMFVDSSVVALVVRLFASIGDSIKYV